MTAPTHHRTPRRRVPAALAASLTATGLLLLACSAPTHPGATAPPTAGAGSSTASVPQSPNPSSSSPGAVARAGGSVSGSSSAAPVPSTPSSPPRHQLTAGNSVSPPGSAPSSNPGHTPDAASLPAPGQPAPASGPGTAAPGQPGNAGGGGFPTQAGSPATPANPSHAAAATPAGGPAISDSVRRAALAAAPAGMAPGTLALPTLGVGPSPLGPTCAEPNGILEPPANSIGMLCDWRGSASLDAPGGEVTIAGHINFNRLPNAAFARLAQMSSGDAIYTSSPSGRVQAWVVTMRYELPKTQPLDTTAFAGPDGPRQLVLVSCGGALSGRSYLNNVYVDASPA